jgi:acetyl-CoA C-acetyltransferase
MAEAYIVAAARTAGGKRGGKLKDWHPVDMGAHVINALLDRSKADPNLIEDVICGCRAAWMPSSPWASRA